MTTENLEHQPKLLGSMLSRGLALLAAFEPHDHELSQTELARRTELPKPTVHRLTNELLRWGALERGVAGVRLGQWLYQLGNRAPRVRVLRRVGQPVLDRLREQTGEFVCLSVPGTSRPLDIAASGHPAWLRAPFAPDQCTASPAAGHALVRVTREPVEVCVAAQEWLGAGEYTHGRNGQQAPRASQHLYSVAAVIRVDNRRIAAVSVVSTRRAFDLKSGGSHALAAATVISRQLALVREFTAEAAIS